MWHLTACKISVSLSFSGATSNDCINTKYQFIKPFLDNRMSIYGAIQQELCYSTKTRPHPALCQLERENIKHAEDNK